MRSASWNSLRFRITNLQSLSPGEYQKQMRLWRSPRFAQRRSIFDDSAIARGLAASNGQRVFRRWDERTIIDGAHNPAAARTLAETWREFFGDQRATLVLAVLSDKDLRGICEALAPISESSSPAENSQRTRGRTRRVSKSPGQHYSTTPLLHHSIG